MAGAFDFARLPAWLRELPAGVFLTGGAARDLLRGKAPADWDLVAVGGPAFAAASEALAERFGRPPVELGKRTGESCRRFLIEGETVDLVSAPALEDDLRRRDFTLNALALDPKSGAIIDPLEGRADLTAGTLRMVAAANLDADPLRVLRAHRFAATLNVALEPATAAALAPRAGALAATAPERIVVELDKLLTSCRAAPALAAMREDGTLFAALPELKPLDGLGQNRYHHADVLTHVIEAVGFADRRDASRALVGEALPEFDDARYLLWKWAVLLHDLGKAATRTEDAAGGVHFYGHELVSERLTREVGERLRFPNERTRRLARLARFHLRFLSVHKHRPGPTALRRLARDLDDDLPLLAALALADKSATRGAPASGTVAAISELAREALTLHARERERLRSLPKLVDGLRACELLGITPGRALGFALDRLLDAQVTKRVETREQAEEFLRGLRGELPRG